MVQESPDSLQEGGFHGIDEGWWASVLSDEDAVLKVQKDEGGGAAQVSNFVSVDWNHVQELFDRDEIINLQVYGCNRGGILVQAEGLQGFVPVSHLVDIPSDITDDDRRCRLAAYVGRSLELKVIECEKTQERIVLSERAALAGKGRRKQLFHSLASGEIIQGSVTNVTDFGVFVDLGGVEGLIHVSELSWGRVQHPADVLQVGQSISTVVLQVNEETSRVALSLKRLYPNPWEQLVRLYAPGDIVNATVTSIMRYGAFARLDEGVEGLIHISSVALPLECKNLEQLLYIGEKINVRILHIDCERRRLGLGLVDENG